MDTYRLTPPRYLLLINILSQAAIIIMAWRQHETGGLDALTSFILIASYMLVVYILGLAPDRVKIVINAESLDINAFPYFKKSIAFADIDDLRELDFKKDTALRPLFKTLATAVFTYRIGRFRLRNRVKAIMIATGHQVICFKDKQGLFYLVAPDKKEQFYQELRRRVNLDQEAQFPRSKEAH